MDNRSIEDLLGRMPLRKPSAALDARILAARPRRRRVAFWSIAGGGLAAAAVILFAGASHIAWPPTDRQPAPGPGLPYAVATATAPVAGDVPHTDPPIPGAAGRAEPSAEPVRVETTWCSVSYEGIVVPDDRTPLMQFRRELGRRIELIDSAKGIRTETIEPREDVVLIKATVY